MAQAQLETALTSVSRFVSLPTDMEAGVGKNSAFPSSSSLGAFAQTSLLPYTGVEDLFSTVRRQKGMQKALLL